MVHQSASKTAAFHEMNDRSCLIASGGDDGSIALLSMVKDDTHDSFGSSWSQKSPPVLLRKAHASAVTACAIIQFPCELYIVTAGNDGWIRLWQVGKGNSCGEKEDRLVANDENRITIRRRGKLKTSVADVSSMAVLDVDEKVAKVVLCGVGMEVIRLSDRDTVD